jgi:hypothetical protein
MIADQLRVTAVQWRQQINGPNRARPGNAGCEASPGGAPALFLGLPEISQVRWRLVLFCRHQETVGTQNVHFLADTDQIRSFDATALPP